MGSANMALRCQVFVVARQRQKWAVCSSICNFKGSKWHALDPHLCTKPHKKSHKEVTGKKCRRWFRRLGRFRMARQRLSTRRFKSVPIVPNVPIVPVSEGSNVAGSDGVGELCPSFPLFHHSHHSSLLCMTAYSGKASSRLIASIFSSLCGIAIRSPCHVHDAPGFGHAGRVTLPAGA